MSAIKEGLPLLEQAKKDHVIYKGKKNLSLLLAQLRGGYPTQAALGEKLGCSGPAVSKIIAGGKRKPVQKWLADAIINLHNIEITGQADHVEAAVTKANQDAAFYDKPLGVPFGSEMSVRLSDIAEIKAALMEKMLEHFRIYDTRLESQAGQIRKLFGMVNGKDKDTPVKVEVVKAKRHSWLSWGKSRAGL